MKHRCRFLLPLIAVLVVGCGNTHGSAATQTRLVAEADPICAKASAKRAEVNARLGKVTSLRSPKVLKIFAETAPSVAADESEAVAKLRTLEAPASIASAWQFMLAGLHQLAQATAQLGLYGRQGNVKAAEKLVNSTQHTREQLLGIATRDGFKSCGRAD